MKVLKLDWTKDVAQSWIDRQKQGRVPHAVMLTGPTGVGKRAMATWMVANKLGLETYDLPAYPVEAIEHADARWLSPPEKKTAILIEQVRDLVANLNLTSYSGKGKAAVIEPAQLMSNGAANSLLKTLEEPPGDALLVLVADRSGRLPATIMSRCQRIALRAPSETQGLAWLDRYQPGSNWAPALRAAGGAPLAAIGALDELDTTRSMANDLTAVATGRASAVQIAEKWARNDPMLVLEWLARQVQAAARANAGDGDALRDLAIDESVLQRMDRRNLFCYLDNINRLRGQSSGSYNVQLALESLLIDWAMRLRDVRSPAAVGAF